MSGIADRLRADAKSWGGATNTVAGPNVAALEREAADQIDALVAERDALRAKVADLANELESEIEHRYRDVKQHPAIAPKYERDMSVVHEARAALSHQQREEGNQDCCRECGEPFVSVPNSGDRGRCEPCRRTYG